MKTVCFIGLLLLLIPQLGQAQAFEGKVIYKMTAEVKDKEMAAILAKQMNGNTEYFYGKDKLKMVKADSETMEWTIIDNAKKKSYMKMKNSPMVMEHDLDETSVEANEAKNKAVDKISVKKNAVTLLGKSCDEVILMVEDGSMKMYFPSSPAITAQLFSGKNLGQLEEVGKSIGIIPYKTVMETKEMTMTNTAIEVTPMALPASTFAIPDGLQIMKMPKGTGMPGGHGAGDGHKH